mmetsp:Transcript_2399/g.5522  ORF Transcript_2399/g.5522 Transcript_2399/m.5522 type:complete len:205 (+) Transcript_2399:2139-2753(+)
MAVPPMAIKELRRPPTRFPVIAFCTSCVSVARRLMSSPVRVLSKKFRSCARMLAKSCLRNLAMILSPATFSIDVRRIMRPPWHRNRPVRPPTTSVGDRPEVSASERSRMRPIAAGKTNEMELVTTCVAIEAPTRCFSGNAMLTILRIALKFWSRVTSLGFSSPTASRSAFEALALRPWPPRPPKKARDLRAPESEILASASNVL